MGERVVGKTYTAAAIRNESHARRSVVAIFPKSETTVRRDAWRRPVETFQMTIILGERVPSVRISRSSVTRRNRRTDEYRTGSREGVRATAVEDSGTVTRPEDWGGRDGGESH